MTAIAGLRIFALASNILFSTYGLLAHVYPVVFLHALLFRASFETGSTTMRWPKSPNNANCRGAATAGVA